MRKIQISYTDIYTGRNNFKELLSSELDLVPIDLSEILRTEYQIQSELGKEIKSYMDEGVIIPTDLVNSLLRKKIGLSTKNILLLNYPRNGEQYADLIELANTLNLFIEKVWYLKLVNLEFVSKKELNKMNPIAVEKYEITTNSLIEKIRKNQGFLSEAIEIWKKTSLLTTIEVDFENHIDLNKYLLDKLKSA